MSQICNTYTRSFIVLFRQNIKKFKFNLAGKSHSECRKLAELLTSKNQKEVLKLSTLFKRYICFSAVADLTRYAGSYHQQLAASKLSLFTHTKHIHTCSWLLALTIERDKSNHICIRILLFMFA